MFFHKGANNILSDNFEQKEFDCKCSNDDCNHTLLHMALVRKLEIARAKCKRPLRITSAFRCQKHNKAVGGVAKSQHMLGGAVDVLFPEGFNRERFMYIMIDLFPFTKVYDSFIHCDLRLRKEAIVDSEIQDECKAS